MSHRQLVWTLSTTKQHTLHSYKFFNWRVRDCASHSFCVSPTAWHCHVNYVVRFEYFGEVEFYNFLFVFAYVTLPILCTKEEWTLLYSALFYDFTQFRWPHQSNVISCGPGGGGGALRIKCVFLLSTILYEIFYNRRRLQRYINITVHRSVCKVQLFLLYFNKTWIYCTQFRKIRQ